MLSAVLDCDLLFVVSRSRDVRLVGVINGFVSFALASSLHGIELGVFPLWLGAVRSVSWVGVVNELEMLDVGSTFRTDPSFGYFARRSAFQASSLARI